MKMRSATLIYFSPTGATKRIASTLASSLGMTTVDVMDMTSPGMRERHSVVRTDMVIIGAPVYEEYIPAFFLDCLKNIEFNKQPTIAFCTYGNIGYGMSLKRLYRELSGLGLSVITVGAFIGEHSFSTDELPLAQGRPDSEDLETAEKMAALFLKRLAGTTEPLAEQRVPGRLPLMARLLPENSAKSFTRTPMVSSTCTHCGVCITKCPMRAIDVNFLIDESNCVRCFSCVKFCEFGARKIEFKKKVIVRNFLKLQSRLRRKSFVL